MDSENVNNNIVSRKNNHMYLPSLIKITDRHVKLE